jgi:hypothetical protein
MILIEKAWLPATTLPLLRIYWQGIKYSWVFILRAELGNGDIMVEGACLSSIRIVYSKQNLINQLANSQAATS